MPSLLIKDLSVQAHKQLREQAKAHQRSMQKEAALLLNNLLGPGPVPMITERIKVRHPLSAAETLKAIKEGRR